jgi:hypothetical protein
MNDKMSRKVAIIILNYNGWRDTVECLESIQTLDYPEYLTIVVDNGSTDGSIGKIKSWARGELEVKSEYIKYNPNNKPVHVIEYEREIAEKCGIPEMEAELSERPSDRKFVLIKNRENLGFSAGNNVGAKYAAGRDFDYVVLLNNDTVIPDRDFINKIIDVFKYDEKIYVVGPKIVDLSGTFDGPYIRETFWGELLFLTIHNQIRKLMSCQPVYIDMKAISSPKPVSVYKISGACMTFKTSFLKDIEYLDENVWLSCEEAILSEQVLSKGGRIYFQPLTTLIHKKARSPRSDSSKIGILTNYYKQREYFLRNYRNYGFIKMSLIRLLHKLRLTIERLKA